MLGNTTRNSMKIGMKPRFRNPLALRLSVYVVISICWLAILLNHCIIAKSYYGRVGSESYPIYSQKQAAAHPHPPYPNTWEPRVENPDGSLPFIESRSIRPYLMEEGNWELVDDCWVNMIKRQCVLRMVIAIGLKCYYIPNIFKYSFNCTLQ